MSTSPRSRAPASAIETAAVDERVRRSKETVLKTTAELLAEGGLGGVSVDEVARRSGVAKTTIYRHWPTRSDLLMDACSRLGTEQEVPDTGSFAGDLAAQLTTVARLLRTARWASVVPSVVDAAERDADLATILGRIQIGHAAPFREIIARAAARGEIPANTDPSPMVASLLGPLFYRRWFTREPIDDTFVAGIVAQLLAHAAGAAPGPV